MHHLAALTGKEIESIITVFLVQLAVFLGVAAKIYLSIRNAGAAREQSIKDEFRAAMEDLKNHNDMSVQKLNGMLTYLIHSFGVPAWLKVARVNPHTGDVEFRMLEVNEDYASTFGIPRTHYIGKTDLEAGWGFHEAQVFRQHDLAVWGSGESMDVVENLGGVESKYRKIRVQSPDGTLKGIFGFCIDVPPRMKLLN